MTADKIDKTSHAVAKRKSRKEETIQIGVFEIITQEYKNAFIKDVYIAPNIPNKKLDGAIKSIANNSIVPNQVLLVYDDTFFGSATDGILLTKDTLYNKSLSGSAQSIKFKEIEDVTHEITTTKDKNGKEKTSQLLKISGKNESIEICYGNINYQVFELFIKNLAASSRIVKNEADIVERKPLEDMPFQIKSAYVKAIINYFMSNNNVIGAAEFSQLYSLYARLKFNTEERFELYSYQSKTIDTSALIDEMLSNVDDVAKKEVTYSLAKDLIYIHSQTQETLYIKSKFIMNFAKRYKISDEQLEFIQQAIDNDKKIYDDNIDDAGLENGFRSIASGAAAVGVPIAAIYFSGSVIGLGAAGITSGLSALGLGGLFGLSGMVTGIGAILLIGYGTKKGIEILTGQGEVDKRKRKEAMLLEVTKHLQRSINLTMQDINYIADKLNEIFADISGFKAKQSQYESTIGKLVAQLRALSNGGQILDRDRANAELCASRQRIPRKLDEQKLRVITAEPTTQEFYTLIIGNYQKEGEDYLLKTDIALEDAQALSAALDRVGYFSTSSVAKQGLNKLSGLFKS